MRFEVQWNYKSSLGGPWLKGDVVDLDEVTAERVNKDSPGVLALKEAPKKKGKAENRMVAEPDAAREAEREEFAKHHDRVGDEGDQGAIGRQDVPGLMPSGE